MFFKVRDSDGYPTMIFLGIPKSPWVEKHHGLVIHDLDWGYHDWNWRRSPGTAPDFPVTAISIHFLGIPLLSDIPCCHLHQGANICHIISPLIQIQGSVEPGAGRELKQMTKIVTAYVRHRSASVDFGAKCGWGGVFHPLCWENHRSKSRYLRLAMIICGNIMRI